MKKMIFDKDETKNLINMLKSPDAENHVVAFEALKNVNIKKYIGALIEIYKFGGHCKNSWLENSPAVINKIEKIMINNGVSLEKLTSPQTLSLITKGQGSPASIELFMEYFIQDMTSVLEGLGYPIDKLSIDIKLKDNGQTTKP